MNNQYVNHLLDETWIVAINEIIESQPETLADVVDPYVLGQYHAEMGEECDPTKYYAKLGQIEEYIIAWKDTKAAMLLAEEYADFFAEQEFVRLGC